MIILPRTVHDIGESLSNAHARNKAENRRVFLKIVENVKFLGRQGIACRGHDDAVSTFIHLFKLRALDDSELSTWLKRSPGTDRYLSPCIQNEMLEMMSLSILRSIANKLQSADAFAIMADECTDLSNHEQLVICFR